MTDSTTLARFWAKVDKTSTCWLWTASRMGLRRNYGAFSAGGKTTGAHRFAYETFVGPIPAGHDIDHLCHVEHCVNPRHLQAVSKELNQQHRKGANVNNQSGVRGVSWMKREQVWRVQVWAGGKLHCGGHFKSLDEAERAAVDLRNRVMTNNLRDRAPI